MRKARLISLLLILSLLAGCSAPAIVPKETEAPEQSPAVSSFTPTPTPSEEPSPSVEPAKGTPEPSPVAETPEPSESPEGSDLPDAALPETESLLSALLGSSELPEDSHTFSWSLAEQAQSLCAGQDRSATAALLTAAGYTVLKQEHFDKDPEDPSHTCAWTLARKTVSHGGESRPLIAIVIRGTAAGEWYSNFDVAPSRDVETAYAENFLAAAEDVFLGAQELIEAEERPLLLVCGHSRGAACANLLGLLLNTAYDPADIYVYTFATPTTVRDPLPETDCGNIFNLINPGDLVPKMPLESWGFRRLGTDIVLPAEEAASAKAAEITGVLERLAPSLDSYYNGRHSLIGSGLSDMGLTLYETMQLLAKALTKLDGTDFSAADGVLGTFSSLSEDSDLYPLALLLGAAMANNGAASYEVLMQHMPTVYLTLIRAAKAAAGG